MFGYVTRAGRTLIGVGLIGLPLALLLRWQELLIVSIGALVLLVLAVPFTVGHLALVLDRRTSPETVTRGESAISSLTFTNDSKRRRSGVLVEDRMGSHIIEERVPSLAPGANHALDVAVPTQRRGVIQLGPAKVVRTDPLGLLARSRELGEVDEIRVWPKAHIVSLNASGRSFDLDGPTSDTSPRGGDAFHTIREYQTGDDHRMVHWRSTAKNGFQKLLVRQFVDTRRPQLIVGLDCSLPHEDPELFELAVEVVASMLASADREGIPAELCAGHRQAIPAVLRYQLDHLSEVQPESNEDAFAQVCDEVRRRTPGGALAVLVTGERRLEDVVPYSRRVRAGSTVIVRTTSRPEERRVLPPSTVVLDVNGVPAFVEQWRLVVPS